MNIVITFRCRPKQPQRDSLVELWLNDKWKNSGAVVLGTWVDSNGQQVFFMQYDVMVFLAYRLSKLIQHKFDLSALMRKCQVWSLREILTHWNIPWYRTASVSCVYFLAPTPHPFTSEPILIWSAVHFSMCENTNKQTRRKFTDERKQTIDLKMKVL